MTTIRHIATLFEYDGPQLFEASDDQGGRYLALMIESENGRDRHLVVKVDQEYLEQFRAGKRDLRRLIDDAASEGWYLANTSNLQAPLAVEPQAGALPVELLPDIGFSLGGAESEVAQDMDNRPDIVPSSNSVEVRERLIRALRLDLVGPSASDPLVAERLPDWVRPSNWYLTGFLIPAGGPPEGSADVDEDEDLDTVPEIGGLAEE